MNRNGSRVLPVCSAVMNSRDRWTRPSTVNTRATKRTGLLVVVTALSVGVVACGGGSDPESTTISSAAPSAVEGGSAETSDNLFPDVDVQLVADGSTVNLKEELQGGDLPVLLWFWAPH